MPPSLKGFVSKLEEFTVEPLFDGHLRIYQPKSGYRYAIDPIILCAHLSPPPGSHIIDIGCGCGIMPVIIGHRFPETTITGIELQKPLADLAKRNCTENHPDRHIRILNSDILDVSPKDISPPANIIISNPPFKKKLTGRLNPNPQKAIARHEITLTIEQLFSHAGKLLSQGGRLMIIFPSDRLPDLFLTAEKTDMTPEWIRFIHPVEEKEANRVIFCTVKDTQTSCRVLPPLTLYSKQHIPTPDYKNLFTP